MSSLGPEQWLVAPEGVVWRQMLKSLRWALSILFLFVPLYPYEEMRRQSTAVERKYLEEYSLSCWWLKRNWIARCWVSTGTKSTHPGSLNFKQVDYLVQIYCLLPSWPFRHSSTKDGVQCYLLFVSCVDTSSWTVYRSNSLMWILAAEIYEALNQA